MYIQHRKLNQPKSGRRIQTGRRLQDAIHDPNRRAGQERRSIADRRQSMT